MLPLWQIMNDDSQSDSQDLSPSRKPRRIALRPVTIILFLTVNLLVMMILGWPYLQARYQIPWSLPVSILPVPTSSEDRQLPAAAPSLEDTPAPSATLPTMEIDLDLWSQGLIVLAIQEGLDSHLFAYQPLTDLQGRSLPLVPLTHGAWQDITPALSPQSDRLAFASNRNGFWNLYQLDLAGGEVIQVTNSPDYIASPSWSPDGLWIAYEAHIDESLDIYLQPVDGSQEPIQLTDQAGADSEPAWAPDGRRIAFVSTREGSNQIWVANLDESGADRFLLLSGKAEMTAAHPVWSPDARYLAWSAVTEDGLHRIFLWDSQQPDTPGLDLCAGDLAAWSPDGAALLVVFDTPYESYLSAYSLEQNHSVLLPPIELPGAVNGLLWADLALSGDLVDINVPTPTPLWKTNLKVDQGENQGRWELVELNDVAAPYPRLHDRVDESFQALRLKLAELVGWDLLADLENAFIPLSAALSPGHLEDWLYTGRAFGVNTLPINAGWMAVVRVDFGQQTYWRVYLRTRFQDGSQGRPLTTLPWDFNARYSGEPRPYEQGGARASMVPPGYWVDMTRVAEAYGWQRLPALSTWKVAVPSARFNEFAFTEGLNWESAMLEIYPSEVLLTLTPLPTATTSVTPAPLWYRSPTPTATTASASTSTPTPTKTLTGTATPTLTQGVNSSPSPSATPTVATQP